MIQDLGCRLRCPPCSKRSVQHSKIHITRHLFFKFYSSHSCIIFSLLQFYFLYLFLLFPCICLVRASSSPDPGAVVIVWWLDLQLPVQSVSITTNVASSNPANGEAYAMQHLISLILVFRRHLLFADVFGSLLFIRRAVNVFGRLISGYEIIQCTILCDKACQ